MRSRWVLQSRKHGFIGDTYEERHAEDGEAMEGAMEAASRCQC